MSKRTCGQVFVLPSRYLVRPAADDDFVIENHLCLALYSSSYENLIIVGDFNVCVEEICMSRFRDTFGLKSLIKEATCYKNPENSSSIDLILTNNLGSFQNSCLIETGVSDFHRMAVTIMKTSFERLK